MIAFVGLMKDRLGNRIGLAHDNMKLSQGANEVSNDKQVTPRTVFILGGKDVRSPSHLE